MIRRVLIALAVLVTAGAPVCAHGAAAEAGGAYAWRLFVSSHPAPLFYRAAGIAADRGAILIADSGDHQVEKLSAGGSMLAAWGTDGPGALHLSGPQAVAADAAGTVYVADAGVLKLSPQGRVLARWSGGVLSYPRGLAVDGAGNLYVLALHPAQGLSAFDRITVVKLSPAGKRLWTAVWTYPQPVGEAALSAAIAVTTSGNLLLSIRAQRHCHACDGTYYLLRTVSQAGRTLAETPEDAGGNAIAVAPGGEIFLTAANTVETLSPNGARLAAFGAPGCGPAQLGADLSLAVSPPGTLYVADSQAGATRPDGIPAAFHTGVLHRFSLDGSPEGLLGRCPAPGARTRFGQINDLAVTPRRTMYVADGITSMIERFGPGGTTVGSFAAVHPSTVATDGSSVYVSNLEADTLEKRSPDGRLVATSNVSLIEAVAPARNGQVYALTVFGQVVVLPPIGEGSRPLRSWWLRGYAPHSGGLDPQGICLDGAGNVWVADIRHNNIQKYSPTGRLLLIWGRGGTGPNRFHTPTALTVDGRGHLFVADSGNNRVQEFDLAGRFLASFGRQGEAMGQFLTPEGIGTDAHGDIFVGDRGNDRVQELVWH